MNKVKKLLALIFLFTLTSVAALAQEKGVDNQNEGIRDRGNDRAPAINGSKQDVGTGRGIDFGKGRTPEAPPVPNPYRFAARRDVILKAVQDLMLDRKLIADPSASNPDEGILISQPYTFTKGAVVATSELGRYAQVTDATSRGWTRGRYILIVEIQPIDGLNTNVSVNMRIEGRSDGPSGPEWVKLRSTGLAEEEFLSALIENVTGAPPPGRAPSQ